jgi:hypothetical protein
VKRAFKEANQTELKKRNIVDKRYRKGKRK